MNLPALVESGIVDIEFSSDVKIIQPVNLYGCRIGDGVFVGPFVEIQRNVVVGRRTQIQLHTFICDLVTIGGYCFIGRVVRFINNIFATGVPACGDLTLWRLTQAGNKVLVDSNAAIIPVSICDGEFVGKGAVVVHDVATPGRYMGNPARCIPDRL